MQEEVLKKRKEKEIPLTLEKWNFPRKFLLTSADVILARIVSRGQSELQESLGIVVFPLTHCSLKHN